MSAILVGDCTTSIYTLLLCSTSSRTVVSSVEVYRRRPIWGTGAHNAGPTSDIVPTYVHAPWQPRVLALYELVHQLAARDLVGRAVCWGVCGAKAT